MSAPIGNRFWEARSRHGRKPIWEEPDKFRDACIEYVEWVHENPLEEAVTYQGEVMERPVPKMRAMSISGLCIFLGVARDTWSQYQKKEGFSDISKEIEEIIRTQKFEGASAGLLKESIIARDLGLADTRDVNLGGQKGNPVEVQPINFIFVDADGC